MPVHVRIQRRHRHRERQHLVAELAVDHVGVALGHGQQQVGVSDRAAGAEVELAAQRHLALITQATQLDVLEARPLPARGDHHMALRQIRLQIERAIDHRMPLPRHHGHAVHADARVLYGRRERQQHIHRQIERARGQLALQAAAVHAHGRDFHLGGFGRERLHQRRHHGGFHEIAQADDEALLGDLRLEALRVIEDGAELLQRFAQRVDQPLGQRRGHHLVALAFEQRVVEQVAQARQRMADRRLREVQLLGRLGDAALGVDRVQHDQQVQIDPRNMHGLYRPPFAAFIGLRAAHCVRSPGPSTQDRQGPIMPRNEANPFHLGDKMMPGDERAVESLAAAQSMRVVGVQVRGEMLSGSAFDAASSDGSLSAPFARPLQAVIVIACDGLGAMRAHLLRLALPLAPAGDEADADVTLSPAETGTCALRFTQAAALATADALATIISIDIAALAPQRLAAHLAQIIGVPVTRSTSGAPALAFGGTQLRFIVADDAGEGLAAIEWATPSTSPASAT